MDDFKLTTEAGAQPSGRCMKRLLILSAVLAAALIPQSADATSLIPQSAAATSFSNWSQYLYSAKHVSENPTATTITPANASTLKLAWKFTPDTAAISGLGGFYASPTVYNGIIYIGARNGYFYALDETSGAVVWKRFIGYVSPTTCGPEGFASTATVEPDPTTGLPTVYVYGATGYLYALDAASGSDVWPPAAVAVPSPTKSDYYAWGSPLVTGGNVYVPISSQCDRPLVRGGLLEFSQATGALENSYYSTPPGTVGASIWSSPLSDGSSIFVTTGNGPAAGSDGYSIVKLSTALVKTDMWAIPPAERISDSDFGASPGMWNATLGGTVTEMVGACNKNGIFYALNAQALHAGPIWSLRVGNPDNVGPGQCDAAPVWDGARLFLAGNGTTINSVAYDGSMLRVDPATGTVIWQTGVTGSIIGTPGMDGSGVIAAATYGSTASQNGLFLIDAATGHILKTVPYGTAQTFGQPVFADQYLLVASRGNGLRAYTSGNVAPARGTTSGAGTKVKKRTHRMRILIESRHVWVHRGQVAIRVRCSGASAPMRCRGTITLGSVVRRHRPDGVAWLWSAWPWSARWRRFGRAAWSGRRDRTISATVHLAPWSQRLIRRSAHRTRLVTVHVTSEAASATRKVVVSARVARRSRRRRS